ELCRRRRKFRYAVVTKVTKLKSFVGNGRSLPSRTSMIVSFGVEEVEASVRGTPAEFEAGEFAPLPRATTEGTFFARFTLQRLARRASHRCDEQNGNVSRSVAQRCEKLVLAEMAVLTAKD